MIEKQLIVSVCNNKTIGPVLQDIGDLFTSHGDVWGELKGYYGKYREIPDLSILAGKFEDAELDEVKATAPAEYYLEQLKSNHLTNRLEALMSKAGGALDDGRSPAQVLGKLQKELSRLNRMTNVIRDLDLTDYEMAEAHIEAVRARSSAMGSPGIPTGIKSIDSVYPTGMAPGHLIVAIGWPGRAKTWFTSFLACKAWEQGFKPMIVSLEMSPESMRDRIYTMLGSGMFRASDFARGSINLDDFRQFGKKRLSGKQPFVIVSNEGVGDVTPSVVAAKIEEHRPDIVICDYHQLFTNNNKSNSPVERAMGVSREFKSLAITYNIPLIDITAATADDSSSSKTPPMLNQVAWSRAIEYDADMAFAVHRDHDSGLIEIVCRKNRHGGEFGFFFEADLDRGIWKESHG